MSWHSTLTLANTLESYKYYGLDKLVDEKRIFFQEITDEDKNIAEEFGYEWIGEPNNIGIGAAYKRLVEETASDLFLFLENDWVLIEEPRQQILDGKELLKINLVDIVRYRHRKNPGEPLWTKQFKDNELSRPEHLLDSIHWTDPDKFPQIKAWHGLTGGTRTWYTTTAEYANWTNNPTMFRTEWLRHWIVPRLSGDIEKAVQPWWQGMSFKVTQGEGLFTHMRLDR